MIEITLLISIVSVTFGVWSIVATQKRNRVTDTKRETTELTTVIVKLESINDDTKEIKNELRSVKNDVQVLRERLTIAEQSVKALHQRVDKFERK